MPLPPYLYTYDPVGTSVANKRTNELHNVAPPNNPLNANFIVPRAAPFFKVGLIVRTGAAVNDPVLEEGVDYILTHPFIEASLVLNKLIYGSIMFLDRQYTGDVYLTYQTLGGGYTLDDYDIVESLTNSLYNIRLVSWTQIEGLPVSYPGLPHTHNDYEDMVGLSEVVAELVQMVAAINAGGSNVNSLMASFQQHLNATMAHSKSQVGLSLVPNYPPAVQQDLETRSNTALMTPFMTLKMLVMYGGASATVGTGLSDDSKADKTTTITGGGLATGGGTLGSNRVITVSKAQPLDIAAGTSDDVALTVSSGVHLIHQWSMVGVEPMDDMLAEIIDIDLIVRPGRYLLPISTITSPINATKLPRYIRQYGTDGVMLIVENVYNNDAGNLGVIQRLLTTPYAEADRTCFERKKQSLPSGTWSVWWTLSNNLTPLVSVDADIINSVVTRYRDRHNVEFPNAITKEADGFIGNYHGANNPTNNVYTVHFGEHFADTYYSVSAIVNAQADPYANSNTDTNAWVKGVHQFAIISKEVHSLSFVVVALQNYANGSNTYLSNNFSVCLTIFGNRVVAAM